MKTRFAKLLLGLAVVAGWTHIPAATFGQDACCDVSPACDEMGPSCGCEVPTCDGGCGCNLRSGLDRLVIGSNGRLFGLFTHTDYCFNDFISPMTNPVFFEDPRTLTEARAIFLHHKTPLLAGTIPSRSVDLLAVQVRAALTERLSIIATKDGYIWSDNPLVQNGWADISAGLKYNLIRNVETQTLLSTGFTYELPSGSNRTLQGTGNGLWNLFTTYGQQLGERTHVISAIGVQLPNDTIGENKMMYWSNHIDRKITKKLYLFSEFNWYNYLSSGGGFPLPVEGGDLFNLGSPGITGNDLVTGAFGAKLKPGKRSEIGIAWELPVTERRGLLDNRLTIDYIIRY